MGFLLFYFNWGLYGYDWLSIRGHIKEYCQLPTYLIRRFHFHNLCRIDLFQNLLADNPETCDRRPFATTRKAAARS
jgi:hypothetical protein